MIYHTVYKITNNINGKIYIGCHKTNDINDKYLGSGKVIKRAIKKYGSENFSKEILAVFDNPHDMYVMESILVNEEFCCRSDTYNLVLGGENSLTYVNENLDHFKSPDDRKLWAQQGRVKANQNNAHIKGSQKHLLMLKTDLDYREWWYTRYINKIKDREPPFKGKRHTEETKRKISKANSKKQKGKNNSNYGKCWIYNKEIKQNKSVNRTELLSYLGAGWSKGRVMKF